MPQRNPSDMSYRETIVLMLGTAPIQTAAGQPDFEVAFGGDYLFSVRPIGPNGDFNGASVQLQTDAGPNQGPSDWVNGPAAVTAPSAAPVGVGIGAGSKVRVVVTGAPSGAGLYVSLVRMPA